MDAYKNFAVSSVATAPSPGLSGTIRQPIGAHRYGCARLGFARLNAFRLGVYEPIAVALVNGIDRSGGTAPNVGLRIEGASIQHVLNEQTDTASFRAAGFVPIAGQRIDVWSGGVGAEQIFGGRILETTRLYESRNENEAFDLQCVDPTWLLGRQLVLAVYVNQSATSIVLDLVARFSRGVTTRNVAVGLPVIDAITFTNETVPVCLTVLCERLAANWYLDYGGDLHVFLQESPDANPITDAQPRGAADFQLTEDLSQVVTKVIGRGGGVGAAIDLPAGVDELPVDEGDLEQSWYAATGGLVEVNAQRVTYSGVRGIGGSGALVGTGNAPSAAVSPTPLAGSSHTVGATYQYVVTFATASGESLPGPAAAIYIQALAPVAPPAVAARSRGAGSYPPGMVTPGASSIVYAVQITYEGGAVGPLGAAGTFYAWDGYDWEVYLGPRSYYTGPDGFQKFYYPTLEPGGPAAPTAYVSVYRSDNGGPFYYAEADAFPSGVAGWFSRMASGYSTTASPPASGYGAVTVRNLQISADAGVTARKLYRTPANGSAFKLLATIANNTATSYADTTPDASLTGAAPPTVDTSNLKSDGQVLLGATEMTVSSTVPFAQDVGPSGGGGWVRIGGMVVRYTGIGTGKLTGIPASGLGAITATIRYGAQALVQPRLVGIPPTGTGSLTRAIRKGDTVTIRLESTDTAARDAMAARLGGTGDDGLIEHVVSDSRFGLVELAAHVTATLQERKDPRRTLTFTSRDPSLQVGRLVTVTIAQPAISGTFRIQRVGLSEIAISGGRAMVAPLRRIEASNKLYKFTDLLRRLRSLEGGMG